MDKLPSVFQNPINKKFDNVQELFKTDDRFASKSVSDINKKINQIFGSLNHVYKSKVKITTRKGIEVVEIVGKTNTNLLTLDGKLINILEINDIEKV